MNQSRLFVLLLSFITCLHFAIEVKAESPQETDSASHLLVVKTDEQLETRFHEIAQTFSNSGTDAVAQSIAADLNDPKKLSAWQDFVSSGKAQVISVKVHPNEAKAIAWMNKRFERMGINNLKLEAAFDSSLEDPTSLHEKDIKGLKWMRYLAGPGVAVAATVLNLPHGEAAAGDYMLLVIPGIGVGVTTVLLELQFAWPYLNNKFWKHVWKFGGPVIGRATNTMVNFLYGMALYGAGVGASYIPVLFGAEPVPFQSLPYVQAMTAAAIGGLTFHIAMGQFQTDLSTEEDRGSIKGKTRYGLETTGVVVNNSARVLDWVYPAGLGTWAQGSFFLLKTLPQLLKTNASWAIADDEVRSVLVPESKKSRGFFSRCGELLSKFNLINLPAMRK
ncbi:MAG: hypothetical protein A2Z20_07265 [Bdellovibrionales bacterium RBG_16_40_8]|nr:MAG: hypothetical protein A2Z20_07265 [Bdellovibrionales bacterium RBG_16_40_8]